MKKLNIKRVIVPIIAALMLFFIMIPTSLACVLVGTNVSVVTKGGDIRDTINGNDYDCILVLGAGLRSDGTPSDMLADRLSVAIDLYNKGVADKIVLSGDRSDHKNYDEVTSMENFCLSRGVDKNDILKDEKGFSTYESMYNLKEVGSFKKIVIVTQKYHLYRALYIAGEMGYEAVGADAAIRTYRGQIGRDVREIAARTKDFFLVRLVETKL